MKNTRRTFLQSLASVPLLGWAFASAKPAMPSLPPVKMDTSEPVYGFDERLTLSDLRYDVVIAGEELRCGDFVAFSQYPQVVKATLNDRPIGMATRSLNVGDEVQDYVLVRGRVA